MKPALKELFEKIEAEDGKVLTLETDAKGQTFFVIEVVPYRKNLCAVENLVYYGVVDYVVRLRGTKKAVYITPHPP